MASIFSNSSTLLTTCTQAAYPVIAPREIFLARQIERGVGITCARAEAQIKPKPSQVGRKQSHSGKWTASQRGTDPASLMECRGEESGTQLSGAGRGSGGPERLAALQTTGFMARRNQPTERAHTLGGEITVVWFHPKPLPQRRRHVGKPASDAAKKVMRKGCHGQTSGLSDRCLSGQNGILVRGQRKKSC
jgi:hypothetical protein